VWCDFEKETVVSVVWFDAKKLLCLMEGNWRVCFDGAKGGECGVL
jgi:hypothetical protein